MTRPTRHGGIRIACTLIAAAACGASHHAASRAQVIGPSVIGVRPEGVHIDSDGILQARQMADGEKLRRIVNRHRREAQHKPADVGSAFVSLPRVFAEARRRHAQGQPIPDDLRYLRGMVRVRYVLVYPEAGDIVIGGPAEPIERIDGRPFGAQTGRPVLQLDDLVVALRSAGKSAEQSRPFGCTIQLKADAARRMLHTLSKHKAAIAADPSRRAAVADAMAEAGGSMPIKLMNLPDDSRFAAVTVGADYLMKRLALGRMRSPVRGVPSYISTLSKPQMLNNRFWFAEHYEPLRVSEDGRAFELVGQRLKVLTAPKHLRHEVADSPKARAYAELLTKRFEDLSRGIPAFADLANLADLSVVAALVRHERLHAQAGWDMAWVLDDASGYPVAKVAVADRAAALANVSINGRVVMFMGGGVQIDPAAIAARQEITPRDRLGPIPKHPPEAWGTVNKSASQAAR